MKDNCLLIFLFKKRSCVLLLSMLLAATGFGQQINIRGSVTNAEDGKPLPGTTIQDKQDKKATQTGTDGQYNITVAKGNTLVYSMVGFETAEVKVGDNPVVNIVLNVKSNALSDVVVTGYTSQKRSEVTAAISTISGKEILKSPVTNVTNSLMGKIPGVIAKQESGRPGNNESSLYIRGRVSENSAALIIVDGVERRSFGDIDPNEIEDISVLKDAASTAIYGIKGANGVFVITTKSGKEGKAKVSFTGNVGVLSPTALPGILPAYESAMLHNEGQINVGQSGSRLFSDADLEIFRQGTGDPLLYPNVNWYKALTRPNWMQTQENISISGGSKIAKYFTSFGYTFEDGMFRDFKNPSGYKTTPTFNRYNFRSNLDLNVTRSTTIGIRIAGRLENRYSLVGNATNPDYRVRFENGLEGLVSRIMSIPAWGVPFFPEYTNPSNEEMSRLDATYNYIEDRTLGPNNFNPYAMLLREGYVSYDNNAFESILNLNQKLDFITKGLSTKLLFGYDAYLGSAKQQTGGYASYRLDRATKELSPISGTFTDPLGAISSQRFGYVKTSFQAFVNYARSFKDHNVAANLIGTRELRGAEGAQAPFANQGLVYNFTYNYNERYFLQASGAYSGSENYPKHARYGFFPSVSLGYTISNEEFFKNINWWNKLKVRGSIGLTGIASAGTGRFLYLDAYTSGTPINFGYPNSMVSVPRYTHSKVGNEFITWEKSLKRNIGIETGFFNNKLTFTLDVYDDKRYDILLPRNNTSFATYGEALPNVNYGENYNQGYEFELGHQNRIGEFTYSVNAQLSYNRNEIRVADESPKEDAYRKTVGRRIGHIRGYKVLGFYKDAADIAASPENKLTPNASIPGDFKYEDLNNDGIISILDQTAIGYAEIPEYVGGLNLSVGYKGITLSALLQGVENVSSSIIFHSETQKQYFEPMLGRWTPTNPNPTWPVIRPGGSAGGNPNERVNDFLLQDASYVKLRNLEVRYTFSRKLISTLKLQGLSVYVNGQNWKTWTKFYGVDPENFMRSTGFARPQNAYPTTKVLNFGLNVQF
jgi:TonB-linked SusC/RagA family outer membrane protein